jgi:tRNA threonylcarbamoyladenosine biosynthesis protein TsaB
MNLLAIDASSENLSLSIMWKNKILFNFDRRIRFGASSIIAYLDKYTRRFSLKLNKFDAFIVGKGPGSFTGLRISFSIVKGFCLSLGKPIITIGSFMSIAYPFRESHDKIAVISDARKGFIYAASFIVKEGLLKQEHKERLVVLEEFVKSKNDYFFITYDEYLKNKFLNLNPRPELHKKNVYPQAKYLLALGIDYYTKKRFTPLATMEPLYLHPKTCQIRYV